MDQVNMTEGGVVLYILRQWPSHTGISVKGDAVCGTHDNFRCHCHTTPPIIQIEENFHTHPVSCTWRYDRHWILVWRCLQAETLMWGRLHHWWQSCSNFPFFMGTYQNLPWHIIKKRFVKGFEIRLTKQQISRVQCLTVKCMCPSAPIKPKSLWWTTMWILHHHFEN